jgi:2-oxoglutarate ferredoxin oxidoreductase subunit alpha
MHNYVMSPIDKIKKGRNDIIEVLSENMENADMAIVSYGTVSRCARAAALLAREEGIKVGTVRLVTCWPLPDEEIRAVADKVDSILVLENNTGQMLPYIKAEAAHSCKVSFLGPEILGQIHDPEYVLQKIKEIAR